MATPQGRRPRRAKLAGLVPPLPPTSMKVLQGPTVSCMLPSAPLVCVLPRFQTRQGASFTAGPDSLGCKPHILDVR